MLGGTGIVIRKSQNADVLAGVRRQLADGADLADVDYSQLVQIDELAMGSGNGEATKLTGFGEKKTDAGSDDPLTAQLRQFLKAVRGLEPPAVDAEAGFAAVDAAHRIISALRAHQWDGLTGSAL